MWNTVIDTKMPYFHSGYILNEIISLNRKIKGNR